LRPFCNIIVSCRGKNGENNALAVAYACNCSYDPPMIMIGIVPDRYSYQMIKDTGVFVVNLVSTANKREFWYLGNHSGRDTDKFKELDLNYEDAIKIDAPILTDFPVNIECEVVDSIKPGSHEMFAGKIVHIQADQEYVNEDLGINFSKINLIG
jgi:flavin reductase (DIM6/NTAB) family NADH-FMN oxidoreductase RutF